MSLQPCSRLAALSLALVLSQLPATATAAAGGGWDCSATDDGWNCNGPATPATAATASAVPEQSARLTTARASGFLVAYPDAYADPFSGNPFAYLDWYPHPDGVSPQTHCEGGYLTPRLRFDDGRLPDDQQPIFASADSSNTEGNRLTRLEGNVYLRKGDRQIRSQQASIEHQAEQAQLDGLVQIREPNLLLLGERAEIDFGKGGATVRDAEFVIHASELRGDADSIERLENGHVVIHDGRYTRCQPGNDSWTINGSEIVLRPDTGLGSVSHATLRLGDVPVLYVPYMYFPIDDRRMSGFLPPRLSVDKTNGVDITVPYYFNLAPHYDDTLTIRQIEKRGTQLENEFRYLHPVGLFALSTSWLGSDKIQGDDRWLFGFDHSGSPARGWRSQIDFTRVSDETYFDDLGTHLDINRDTHLQQLGSVNYSGSSHNFSLVAQDYQVIDLATTDPYAKLPQATFWGSPAAWNSDRLQLKYLAEVTRFDRNPEDFTGSARTTGDRAYVEASIGTPFNWPWAFIRPSIELSHTRYALENQPAGTDDAPSRTQPRFSLDTGLFFERPVSLGEDAYIQTLEPRLFLVEAPFRDQSELPNFDSGELTFGFGQLFRKDRFSGRDRTGDTRQATIGVTSRFLESSGRERFALSGGQIFYFEDREVRLDGGAPALEEERSEFAAEASWRASDALTLSADALWTEDFSHNRVRNFKLGYRSDLDHQFHTNYRFTDDELEQLDLSLIWPLNSRWSVVGRWLQDLENSEPLDQIAGLEYENCCWQVRTLYRYWINDNSVQRENEGIFFQIVLKGLGSLGAQAAGDSGGSAKSFLKDITGFEEREDL
ncbi:LPS-assembly protein LptD [Motiliproteus sediminis]|uniref:LPS-assembly protein LptD n=1 Tax=Motiliproteus sediminis TaxID=1468178 RepID=UPI001AEF3719|nr:LPS-assembly protein LptD [Motiliproteus sediminis]